MKKILKTFFVLILTVVFSNTTFSANIKTQRIVDIKNRVEEIGEKTKKTEEEIHKIKKEIFINKFFKTELLTTQREKLKRLVAKYTTTKNDLEEKIKNTIDKEVIKKILENEKEIYKQLLPFVKKEKYEEYKIFIKKDLELINKKINLETIKNENNQILNTKLNSIKQKIIKHNNLINRKIKKIVNKKIDEKLENFTKKEKFQKLNLTQKKLVFQKLNEKLKTRLNKLENSQEISAKKISIYKLIIERINSFSKRIK